MKTSTKILLGVLGMVFLAIAAVIALMVYSWMSIPDGQRDYLLGRDTEEARQVEQQITDAERRSAVQQPITVNSPAPIQQDAQPGDVVHTPCFEFSVGTPSRVTGDGCRVYLVMLAESGNPVGDPYLQIEATMDTPGQLSLEQASDLVLQSVAQQHRIYRSNVPLPRGYPEEAPFDSNDGAYLGGAESDWKDMPTITMRWGVKPRPGVDYHEEKACPPDDQREKVESLAPYRVVSVTAISRLPEGRYVWDGHPQGYLITKYQEKGCLAPFAHAALDSLALH